MGRPLSEEMKIDEWSLTYRSGLPPVRNDMSAYHPFQKFIARASVINGRHRRFVHNPCLRASNVQQYAQRGGERVLTNQTAHARNRAMVRTVIGVLIAMLAIYGATHIQPSDGAATLASRVFGILIAVLSLYLIASGIKSVPSPGACSFRHSDK